MSYDPLAGLRQMPREPRLWDFEKEQRDNNYAKATPKETAEMQKEIWGALGYGPFVPSEAQNSQDWWQVWETEEKWNTKTEQEQKREEILKDSPYYPMLENLRDSGHIDEQTFNETVEKLKEVDKDEAQTVITEVVSWISDGDVRKKYLQNIEWTTEKFDEENFWTSEFYTDTHEILELKPEWEWVWNLEFLLAENYISTPENKNKTKDVKKDVSKTMDVVTNKIIEKHSVNFREKNWALINEIRWETNLKSKYNLLKDLHKESVQEDAPKLWKNKETFQTIEQFQQEAERLSNEYQEAQKIPDVKERDARMAEIIEQRNELIRQAIEFEKWLAQWWDVVAGVEEKLEIPDQPEQKERQA